MGRQHNLVINGSPFILENIPYVHYNMLSNYNCFLRIVNLFDIISTSSHFINFRIHATFQ